MTREPKTIFLDIDGVVLDTEPRIRIEISKMFERSLPVPTDTYFLEDAYGLSRQDLAIAIERAWAHPIEVLGDVKNFIAAATKHRIIGLTVRPSVCAARAVRRDLIDVNLDGLIIVSDPHEKWKIIGDGSIYVDDCPTYAATAGENNTVGAYLRHQLYNQSSLDLGNYERIDNLMALMEEPWFVA